jgi:hypothetical protein
LALTGLPFTIRAILAIQHSLLLRRRIARQYSHYIRFVGSKAIIWAIPAMSNLAAAD